MEVRAGRAKWVAAEVVLTEARCFLVKLPEAVGFWAGARLWFQARDEGKEWRRTERRAAGRNECDHCPTATHYQAPAVGEIVIVEGRRVQVVFSNLIGFCWWDAEGRRDGAVLFGDGRSWEIPQPAVFRCYVCGREQADEVKAEPAVCHDCCDEIAFSRQVPTDEARAAALIDADGNPDRLLDGLKDAALAAELAALLAGFEREWHRLGDEASFLLVAEAKHLHDHQICALLAAIGGGR